MKIRWLKCFFAGIVATVFMAGAIGQGVAAEPPRKVAILPFSMHAERDLSYLRDGIQDMLASRVYWKDRVEVMDKSVVAKAMTDQKGPLNPESAEEIGRKVGADYVLFGSLTLFGNSLSMDATMVSLNKQEAPVTLYVQTQGMETVIPEIDKFAQKVNAQIFGRVAPEAMASAPAPYSAPAAGGAAGASPLNPNFKQLQQVGVFKESFWKSKVFKTELRGMDIGDVDGDGKNEFVLLEDIDVVVYRWQNGGMKRLGSYESKDKERFIAVDVADINGDGRAEIFASKVSGLEVKSVVLEMGAKGLTPVVAESPWLFRVMAWPGRGRILVGQKKRFGAAGGETALIRDYFEPGVFQLVWKGGDYDKAEATPLIDQKGLFVYNFAVGDLDGDHTPEVVLIDGDCQLHLRDMAGAEYYKGSDIYGGSLNYVVTNPQPDATRETPVTSLRTDYLYIPARILIEDLDGDGKNEVIINHNKSMTGGYTERFQAFSDGKIVSLLWNGIALEPVWESRKLNGCVSDYQIKDLDNDGKEDLVVALLQERRFSLVSPGKSLLVSYKLQLPEGQPRATTK